MSRRTVFATALTLSLAALVATLLARPSGAAHRTYTFALVTSPSGNPQSNAKGGRVAAKALGMRYILAATHGGVDQELIRLYESMIARHVDAIATDGYDPSLTPILTKIRKAGILLVSSGDDIAAKRELWVSGSDPEAYGRALADALASQIDEQGEYAILKEQGEFPIADTWEKVVASYIPKAYPNMKLDGVLVGSGAGDEAEVDSVKSFMSDHPNLKGLIAVVPTEAWMAAEAITQAGKLGQVFSAGNGGDYFLSPLPGWVRSGAAEFVYAYDPVKLGYLTVWGAHYLLTGHHFRPGAYQVGGPVGLVYYYAKNQELRLGQPLTITKANATQYANSG